MKSKITNHLNSDKLTTILLAIYLLILIWILLLKFGVNFSYMEKRNFNLIPFKNLIHAKRKIAFAEPILNVLIFIPLGTYIGVLFRNWPFLKKVFLIFSLSFFIEILQFWLKIGAFDSTDVVTNTLGGVLGILIYIITSKLFKNQKKAQQFVNIVAVVFTLFLLTLLILLKLDMLPIRYR